MKRITWIAIAACVTAHAASAANSVTVESKTFPSGAISAVIGIYVINDSPIQGFVCPLTVRTVTGGAFISQLAIRPVAGARFEGKLDFSRVYHGYLTPSDSGCWVLPPENRIYSSGFKTIAWSDTLSHAVGPSPVACYVSCIGLTPDLPPGSDTELPSFRLIFDVDDAHQGSFEVDTTCTAQNNHLVFAQQAPLGIIPSFTKGIITVTSAACNCPLQGDLNGDHLIDVFDIIRLIDVAFGGTVDPQDSGCPRTRGDADNNGVTDVFDVIYLIATAFSSGPTPVNPCGP